MVVLEKGLLLGLTSVYCPCHTEAGIIPGASAKLMRQTKSFTSPSDGGPCVNVRVTDHDSHLMKPDF